MQEDFQVKILVAQALADLSIRPVLRFRVFVTRWIVVAVGARQVLRFWVLFLVNKMAQSCLTGYKSKFRQYPPC